MVFVRVPGNIALVMIAQQDQPLLPRAVMAPRDVRSARDHVRARLGSAKSVRAGVEGILQEVQDRIVVGQAPRQPVAPDRIAREHRQRDLLLVHPEQDLPGAAERGEFLKDQPQRGLYALVGMLFQPPVARLHIPDRQANDEVPAPGLGRPRLVGALPEPAELRLTHRALEPQEQPIVELTRIVDPFGVDDQCVQQAAEIEQLIPVAIVAGQARDLEAHHGADAPQADLRDEPLKAGAVGRGRAGLAEVFVDDQDLAPAERAGMLRQVILPPPTFWMMADLIEGGLAHVDDRGTGQVLGVDLGVTGHGRPRRDGSAPRPAAAARRADRTRARAGPPAPPPTASRPGRRIPTSSGGTASSPWGRASSLSAGWPSAPIVPCGSGALAILRSSVCSLTRAVRETCGASVRRRWTHRSRSLIHSGMTTNPSLGATHTKARSPVAAR